MDMKNVLLYIVVVSNLEVLWVINDCLTLLISVCSLPNCP